MTEHIQTMSFMQGKGLMALITFEVTILPCLGSAIDV